MYKFDKNDWLSKFITIAVDEAKKSVHKQRIGCVIFSKNRIVSKGYNTAQKSRSSITKKFLRWKGSIHAEVEAILQARTDLKGMSILVVRINKVGMLRLARPCEHCLAYLAYVGIKHIYYSINDEKIVMELK